MALKQLKAKCNYDVLASLLWAETSRTDVSGSHFCVFKMSGMRCICSAKQTLSDVWLLFIWIYLWI